MDHNLPIIHTYENQILNHQLIMVYVNIFTQHNVQKQWIQLIWLKKYL